MKSLEEIFASEVLTPGNVASVRKLVHHLTSGYRDADREDLVQIVFTNAWRALGKFQGGSTYRTWLYRIAVNAAFDELRRVRRNAVIVSLDTGDREGGPSLQEFLADSDPVSDPYRYVFSREVRAVVQNSLNFMSPIQAEVVRMRESGLCHKEIAAILGTTDETSKNYEFRGRERLRKDLTAAGVIQ